MKWVKYILFYTVNYFLISFLLLCVFMGGVSLYYSKMKLGEFVLYINYYDVFLLSSKVAGAVFLTAFLHVIFIQIPNEKKKSSYKK